MTLRRVSAKRARENRERKRVLREVFDRQDGRCARCATTGPLDGHELLRRSQHRAGITDADLIVGLCRRCHDWVTRNPQAAHDAGWAMWSWEYERGREA